MAAPVDQAKGPKQYANGGWGDQRDRQMCMYFAGQGQVPPNGTSPAKHLGRAATKHPRDRAPGTAPPKLTAPWEKSQEEGFVVSPMVRL